VDLVNQELGETCPSSQRTAGSDQRPPDEPLRIALSSHPIQQFSPNRVHQFKRRFDQVLGDLALGDEVHNREEQEGFVRCAMLSDLRVPITAPVGPKSCEHLEAFLKHLSKRAPQALLLLIVETRSDRESNEMMNVL